MTDKQLTDAKTTHPRNPYLTVDMIVECKKNGVMGIVLIDRKYEPLGYALPGGFAEWGLSLEDNAIKEVKEETGLDYKIYHPLHPLSVRSDPDRDPRGHMVSVLYTGRGYGILQPHPDEDAKKAIFVPWADLDDYLPGKNNDVFAFPDHADMIQEYWERKKSSFLSVQRGGD